MFSGGSDTVPSVILLADETGQTTSEVSFSMTAVSTFVITQWFYFKADDMLFLYDSAILRKHI